MLQLRSPLRYMHFLVVFNLPTQGSARYLMASLPRKVMEEAPGGSGREVEAGGGGRCLPNVLGIEAEQRRRLPRR